MEAPDSIDKIVDGIVEAASNKLSILTGREREELLYIANGMTDSQIAEKLSVEVNTAESHVGNICHSLGVNGRTLTAVAVRYCRAQDPTYKLPFMGNTPRFTPRQAQVLSLAGRGLTNRQIAEYIKSIEQKEFKEKTVEKHLERISGTLPDVPRTRRAFWAYAAWYALSQPQST